ncbi:glycosyltransferase [Lysinibacillus xylanilyticus]|uniref:glycosyltransferase n=1 Tax=Lysinibacillus xylanilyticus TaxID=582475 RepID=UPI003CFE509B
MGFGGAETMLYRLLQSVDRDLYEVDVICLTEMGVYGELIQQQLNMNVYICDLRANFLRSFLKCFKVCKNSDIIQTWMYHSNLLGYLISRVRRKKLIWGIHHSNLDKKENKWTTILIAKLCARLSKKVDIIISCGPKVKEIHEEIGYDCHQHKVIVNGINTDLFKPSVKRQYYFEHFNVENRHILLHVGRWDPLKDYKNLIASLQLLRLERQDFYMFLVGFEIDANNRELLQMIKEAHLEDVIFLLGGRDDISQLMSAADLFVLSSSGEGLPNVLVEALASGTCCITTDVGDCKYLVREFGETVTAKDANALAQAINKALNYSSKQYAKKAKLGREHVLANFNIKEVIEQYQSLYPMVLPKSYSK